MAKPVKACLASGSDSEAVERHVSLTAVSSKRRRGSSTRKVTVVVDFPRVVGVGRNGGAHRGTGRRPVAGFELGDLKGSRRSMQRRASARSRGVWTEVDLLVEFEGRRHSRADGALGSDFSDNGSQGSVQQTETQVNGQRNGENQSQVDQQGSGGLRRVQVEVCGSSSVGFQRLDKVLGLLVLF